MTRPSIPLPIRPLRPWPAIFPRVVWRGFALSQKSQSPGMADLDLSHLPLGEALLSCFDSITLVDVAHLTQTLISPQTPVSAQTLESKPTFLNSAETSQILSDLYQRLGYREDDHLKSLLALLPLLPSTFQDWAHKNDLNPRELTSLLLWVRSGRTLAALEPFLDSLTASRATRTEGLRLLELFVDLALMDRLDPNTGARSPNEEVTAWVNRMEDLRYPHTRQKDRSRREVLSALGWPKGSRAQWVRRGDTAGVELKFFFHNPTQWQKFVSESTNLNPEIENLFSLTEREVPHP